MQLLLRGREITSVVKGNMDRTVSLSIKGLAALAGLLTIGAACASAAGDNGGLGVVEFALPTQFSYPIDADSDKTGRIWFTAQNTAKIVVFDPKDKKFREYDLPKGSSPYGIDVDKDGIVWFTLYSERFNSIGRLDPATGKTDLYKLPTPNAEPNMIAAGADGSIWFTERNANRIGVLKNGAIKEHKIPTPNSRPAGIAVDQKGVVWFTESVGNKLGMFDPSTGKGIEFTIPAKHSNPSDVAIDSKGGVWFVEATGGRLIMFDPSMREFNEARIPTVNSVPVSVAISPTGEVWFTENKGNKIGSFNPESAQFREFEIPTSSSLPMGIAVDQNGVAWFTEAARDANKLGAVMPGGASSKQPATEHRH